MKFRTVYLTLTAFYVAIIMAVSLFFSFLYYRNNDSELTRGLSRQADAFQREQSIFLAPRQQTALLSQAVEDSESRVRNDLIWANLSLLVASSFTCYALARRTLKPIEDAMEEQARFTADASHELRTPLTAMRAETEVALRDTKATAAELREQLASNMEEVGKLERLSSALLSLARQDADQAVARVSMSVNEAWNEAQERLSGVIKEREARITTVGEDVSVLVLPDTLQELFVILLENAIKYSPDKPEVRLVIKTEKNRLGLPNAVLMVEDHGQGISATDLQHIFDRFYRADRSRRTEGYGLGLSIAQQIAKRSGGDIKVQSKVGKGTRFTIRLIRG
jgi:signal transduction histidine kinase